MFFLLCLSVHVCMRVCIIFFLLFCCLFSNNIFVNCISRTLPYMCIEYCVYVNTYRVSAQGVNETWQMYIILLSLLSSSSSVILLLLWGGLCDVFKKRACVATNKGVNQFWKDIWAQRTKLPTVTVTWHASKYKVHQLHQSYIPSGIHNGCALW